MNQTYAIISRKTGRVIAEVGYATAAAADRRHFETIPFVSWLARYNRLVRETGGEPSSERLLDAIDGGLGA